MAEGMAGFAVQYAGPRHIFKPALEVRLPSEEHEVSPPVGCLPRSSR